MDLDVVPSWMERFLTRDTLSVLVSLRCGSQGKEFSPLPKMPPKKAVGNRKHNFIERRREKLETYLKTLVQTHPRIVHNQAFKSFIDYISPAQILNTGAFASLGEKLILHIFSFLPPRDLLALANVCSYFNRLVEDDSLWEPKAVEDFNVSLFSSSFSLRHCRLENPAF